MHIIERVNIEQIVKDIKDTNDTEILAVSGS